VVKVTREICCRLESNEDRLMRIMLEKSSALCVELEAAAAEGGLIYRVQQSVGQSVELTPESFQDRVLYWVEDEHSTEILLQRSIGQAMTLMRLERGSTGHLAVEVAALELKTGREAAKEFATRFGRKQAEEDASRVCVSFWRDAVPYPGSNDRFLDTVRWEDISRNYNAVTRRKLDRLMSVTNPSLERGRLMLWQGKPGTGKTYALFPVSTSWTVRGD